MEAPENQLQKVANDLTSSESSSGSSTPDHSERVGEIGKELNEVAGSTPSGIESLLTLIQTEEVKRTDPPSKEIPSSDVTVPSNSGVDLVKPEEPMDIDAILKQAKAEALSSPLPTPMITEAKRASSPIAQEIGEAKNNSDRAVESKSEIPQVIENGGEVETQKSLISVESSSKEFDISTDPDVIEMRARMKEKVQEILKSFVNFKTFSTSFIIQMPHLLLRRRKVKQGLRTFTDWIENEKSKINAIEDRFKKETLEKATIIFDQEILNLRRKGVLWIRQGWRKSFLVIVWIVSLIVGLSIGIPSVLRLYFPKTLRTAQVKEMALNESTPLEEAKKDTGPTSYLLLSCEESEMGKLGRIRVYDRECREVASFPANVNKMKKKVLIEVPSGELGVIIETEEHSIVGKLEVAPNQRRFIDLSQWTDVGARAFARIVSTPEGIPIVCNGAWIGKGFASVYFIAGVHKIWAALPNFPAQEQQIMVVDDRELDLMVTVNMGRFVFQCPDPIKKLHPQLKIYVNGSIVLNWESYPLLFGYYTIKINDAGKTIMQQEVNLSAADEVVFLVQRLEGGQLSGSIASKRNLLNSH